MEPISLIVTAIAMGAVSGVKDAASHAVGDAYAGLKELLRRRYGSIDVTPVEAKPQSTAKRESLAEDLASAGAGEDAELLERARAMVDAIHAHDPGAAASIGVDLQQLRAASLRVRDVTADGVGVRVRDADIQGDVEIAGIHAHARTLPKS
jgi:hypothetical protein